MAISVFRSPKACETWVLGEPHVAPVLLVAEVRLVQEQLSHRDTHGAEEVLGRKLTGYIPLPIYSLYHMALQV